MTDQERRAIMRRHNLARLIGEHGPQTMDALARLTRSTRRTVHSDLTCLASSDVVRLAPWGHGRRYQLVGAGRLTA